MANITLQQYADDSDAKKCEVVDVYDKDTLNQVLTKKRGILNSLNSQTLQGSYHLADLTDVEDQAKSLLPILKDAGITSKIIQNTCNQEKLYNQKSWNSEYSGSTWA